MAHGNLMDTGNVCHMSFLSGIRAPLPGESAPDVWASNDGVVTAQLHRGCRQP